MEVNPVLRELPSSRESTVLPKDIIDKIWGQYEYGDPYQAIKASEWANSTALNDRITSWCKWFADNYPPNPTPMDLVLSQGWGVDFRIFFLAFPCPGALLLRFADACYDVDKAIYGTSAAGLREVEEWRGMDLIKYMLSEDLIARWKKDLCQLLDDIECDTGNRLSNIFRVQEISSAFDRIEELLDGGLIDDVFSVVDEICDSSMSFTLIDRIYTRKKILKKSLKVLELAVDQVDQRAQKNTTKPPISTSSISYQDPGLMNQGARRRVRTGLTNHGNSLSEDVEERNPIITQVSPPYSSDAVTNGGSQMTTNRASLGFQSSMDAAWQRVAKFIKSNGAHRTRNKLLDFLIHRSTVLCLTLCVVGTSVALIAVSVILAQTEVVQQKSPLDSNFYSMFSQAMLSLLTIYLTILPPLRSRSLSLRYRSWFWLCLMFSAIASIVSLAVYVSQPSLSSIFAYGAGFAQVVSTLLLVECIEKVVNAGVIGGLEMN